jgi:DNA-binding NarL/FixJ family response regulator
MTASGLLNPSCMKVASLVAQGFTNRGISKRLGIKEKTVSNYLADVYQLLGIPTDRVDYSPRVMLAIKVSNLRQEQEHQNDTL